MSGSHRAHGGQVEADAQVVIEVARDVVAVDVGGRVFEVHDRADVGRIPVEGPLVEPVVEVEGALPLRLDLGVGVQERPFELVGREVRVLGRALEQAQRLDVDHQRTRER